MWRLTSWKHFCSVLKGRLFLWKEGFVSFDFAAKMGLSVCSAFHCIADSGFATFLAQMIWQPISPLKVKIFIWSVSNMWLPTYDPISQFLGEIDIACSLFGEYKDLNHGRNILGASFLCVCARALLFLNEYVIPSTRKKRARLLVRKRDAINIVLNSEEYSRLGIQLFPGIVSALLSPILSAKLYFDKITELTLSRSDSPLFKEALVSLATDSGLHPLVPYFSYFIADEVTRSLNELPLLIALMRVVRSILRNPHVHIEPYLHQLMPSIITCLVAKRLGHRFADNHWELRDFSASLVASICRRFGHVYHNLQSRVTKTLLNAFLDPSKAMTQHYGAIQGLAALGPNVVRLLILPNIEPYLQLLEPEMLLDKQKNEAKRNEAWRVYGALMCAAGHCLYERLKLFPGLLSGPTPSVRRTSKRVISSMPNKRKSSSDLSAQQPPLKKLAADGSVVMPAVSTPMTADVQGTTDGFPLSCQTGTVPSPTSGQVQIISGASRRERGKSLVPKASLILAQAWKEDVDAGNLLASLFELFGEGMLSFIQPAELSLFL